MLLGLAMVASPVAAEPAVPAEVQSAIDAVMPKVVDWRRDIHEHPELGNREFRASKLVAEHLRSLGLEVKTEIAHTGVVGILRGAKNGPVIGLRADMDALPVTEQVDLPFASKVRTEYNGVETGVAHACGHDNHVAILMGVAEVLAGMKEQLSGTVMFVFQPAEEGAPEGEEGGAELMLKEGIFDELQPDAMFALHVMAMPVGYVGIRSEGIAASSDTLKITVNGAQTHGGMPWNGVDPIVVSSQIVNALQTIPSRQLDVTKTPTVISLGSIHGGVRSNIVPDQVEMEGTIRTFDPGTRERIHELIERTVTNIAESAGATADVSIERGYPATINNAELTRMMTPTLQRVGGDGFAEANQSMASEDFAFFAEEVPGLYFFIGVVPEGRTPYPNHSPKFYADESALPIGVTAMTALVLDYLEMQR